MPSIGKIDWMPTTLTFDTGKSVNLDDAREVTSREAACVYLKGLVAYKLYTNETSARKVYADFIHAKNSGVPIVRDVQPIQKAILSKDGHQQTVYVLASERHIGQFFQLSKNGHQTALDNAVTQASSAQPGIEKKVERALAHIGSHGITDPQVFFDPTLGMPIRFIDIHRNTSHAVEGASKNSQEEKDNPILENTTSLPKL